MQAEDVAHHHYLLEESHACLSVLNIHLRAWRYQDHSTDILSKFLLVFGQAVEHCIGALVVAHVEHLVNVVVHLIAPMVLFEHFLDSSDHSWDVIQADLGE